MPPQGRAFHFNASTVTFARAADNPAASGQVLYTGSCDVSGHTHVYSVSMEAPVTASTVKAIRPGSHSQQAQQPRATNGAAPPAGVRVTARRVRGAHVHAHAAAQGQQQLQQGQHPQQQQSSQAPSQQQQQQQQHPAGVTPDEQAVSEQLSKLFSTLTLNMQGVELSTPKLRLVPQSGPGSAAAGARGRQAGAGPSSSHGGAGSEPLLLEIKLDLRLLSLPPLNMKF